MLTQGITALTRRQQRHASAQFGDAHCRQAECFQGLRVDPLDNAGLGRRAQRLRNHVHK